MRAAWGFLAVLVGCGSDAATDEVGASAECGDAAPIIETLTVVDAGLSDPATSATCGDTPTPRVRAQAHATDADGDLHYWSMRVWWDVTIDGVVAEDAASAEVYGEVGDACEVAQADLGVVLCVAGDLPSGREVEFVATVADDEAHVSARDASPVAVFTTP